MSRSRVSAAGLALVAAVALVVSFLHLQELCTLAGESELTATLTPLSVDGLLVAAGATLRVQSNRGHRDPLVALAFVAGILATVAGNTFVGLQVGTLGAIVAAWTPFAALLSFESWIRSVAPTRDERVPESAPVASEYRQTIRERVEQLLDERSDWTTRTLAARAGSSESYARRLLAHNGARHRNVSS